MLPTTRAVAIQRPIERLSFGAPFVGADISNLLRLGRCTDRPRRGDGASWEQIRLLPAGSYGSGAARFLSQTTGSTVAARGERKQPVAGASAATSRTRPASAARR